MNTEENPVCIEGFKFLICVTTLKENFTLTTLGDMELFEIMPTFQILQDKEKKYIFI